MVFERAFVLVLSVSTKNDNVGFFGADFEFQFDCCNPSGEELITNKSFAYIRQFKERFPSITPGQLFSLKYCGKSFINNENRTLSA